MHWPASCQESHEAMRGSRRTECAVLTGPVRSHLLRDVAQTVFHPCGMDHRVQRRPPPPLIGRSVDPAASRSLSPLAVIASSEEGESHRGPWAHPWTLSWKVQRRRDAIEWNASVTGRSMTVLPPRLDARVERSRDRITGSCTGRNAFQMETNTREPGRGSADLGVTMENRC